MRISDWRSDVCSSDLAAATDSGRRPGRPFAGPNVLMALIVQKFGGTSVADVDRIRSVALRVKREVDSGNRVAVVVSAMAGATNQLVDWVRATAPLHDSRDYDVIVASGAPVPSGLIALVHKQHGIPAPSLLGGHIPFGTTGKQRR